MSAEIWVLGDNRLGNTNQAIALAEEIGLEYELKNIKYNSLCKLPNFFLKFKPVHIKESILSSLAAQQFPKIIISSGRRTAPLALYLKKKSNNRIKVIQIMNPNINSEAFDLIILPQHDKIRQISSNVVRIIGALSNSNEKMKVGAEALQQHYPDLKNFIAVIIGGDTKNYQFSKFAIENFNSILMKIAINHSSTLFFSFSRRTPDILKRKIKENFLWPHIIYDPEGDSHNPYFGMLAKADYIICTADSISMNSEIASTGKPLFIYCPNDFEFRKHRFFIQQLFDIGVARKLNNSTNLLEDYSYIPLNEVKKVADIIKVEILNDTI
jgi:mitochondrial fission protein ELM1